MPYVDLAGLSRFAGKSKDFASSMCAGPDMANWQRTPVAGAVSFAPVPEMPLDPVVNFLFSETGPASGTKGPDNPSTITGVTQAKVTRCGKNLCPGTYIYAPGGGRGISATYDLTDGGWSLSGTALTTYTPFFYFFTSGDSSKFPSSAIYRGLTYTFSLICSDSNVSLTIIDSNTDDFADGVTYNIANNNSQTIQISNSCKSFICRLAVAKGATVNTKAYIQVELGSAATAFEPYSGADCTVNLNGTYYGGSVDLSAGTMTVTHGGLVFDGTEHDYWHTGGELGSSGIYRYGFYPLTPSGPTHSSTTQACTHLPYEYNYYSETEHFYVGTSLSIFIKISTLEAFKSWLAEQYSAGHPLSVVYDYSTPLTVQLTPTQIYSLSQPDPYAPRINTVYSDQVSVQVGYPKSPQATQNELTNAVVSLGGNV